jgi:glycine dehydrogenase subunit 2
MARPGDMGFDVVHINLHKTFSTPHGGGGPGAGPVGVTERLVPFLPVPVVTRAPAGYALEYDRPQTVGKMRAFGGNFGVLVRAYAFLRAHGGNGLRQMSRHAVLNANYVQARLRDAFPPASPRTCMHECVLTAGPLEEETGVDAGDVGKALLDHGFHAPTVYFPLPKVVPEALMIEPTETEAKITLDEFIEAMLTIAREAREDADRARSRPLMTPVRRVDEVTSARHPKLRWAADS